MLAMGKTNRVICAEGERIVDRDITEALEMKKTLNPEEFVVMKAMTGV
jgi:6-phosphofructokinase 1